jgi:hypothetical protein
VIVMGVIVIRVRCADQFVQPSDGVSQGKAWGVHDQRHEELVFLAQVQGKDPINRPRGDGTWDSLGLPEFFDKSDDHPVFLQHAFHQESACFRSSRTAVQGPLFRQGMRDKLRITPTDKVITGRSYAVPVPAFNGINHSLH